MAEVSKGDDGRWYVFNGPRVVDSFDSRTRAEAVARAVDRENLRVDARRAARYRDVESPRARLERRRKQRGSSDLKVTLGLAAVGIGAAAIYGHVANKRK